MDVGRAATRSHDAISSHQDQGLTDVVGSFGGQASCRQHVPAIMASKVIVEYIQ